MLGEVTIGSIRRELFSLTSIRAKNNQSLNVIVIGCFDYVNYGNYGLGAVT